MIHDYWNWMGADELPKLLDQLKKNPEGNLNRRESWLDQNLASKLWENAHDLTYYHSVEQLTLAVQYLTAMDSMSGNSEEAKLAEELKRVYVRRWHQTFDIPSRVTTFARQVGLTNSDPDPALLPRHTVVWRFDFKLADDYISRDDVGLYVIDNPVRKERLLKLPEVAATGWKGALRSAFRACHSLDDGAMETVRLFGSVRDDDTGLQGRLHFYPSYFDKLSVRVINPHDRQTGVGVTGPILFETVPQGSTALFLLMYVPLPNVDAEEVAQDLELVSTALHALLCDYGFGAKTSSGAGVAEEQLPNVGSLCIHASLQLADHKVAAPSHVPDLPRYLESPGVLRSEFRRADGSLASKNEYRSYIERQGRAYGKRDDQLYEKAKRWWDRVGQELWQQRDQLTNTPKSAPAPPAVSTIEYRSLKQMVAASQQIASALRRGGSK